MGYSSIINSTDLAGIPEECHTSEKPCLHLYDLPCFPIFATSSAVIVFCLYFPIAFFLFIKLLKLQIKRKRFTLKKGIFGCMFVGSILRVTRVVLILGGPLNKTAYFFDSFLLYFGFAFLFLSYFLLVSFWAGVCSKRGAIGNWFNLKMQKILVLFIITTFLVYCMIPFVDTFANFVYIQVLVNSFAGIYLIILSVGSIYQGLKILRLLSNFQFQDRAIVRSVTRLCLAASITMTITLIIFSIVILIEFIAGTLLICQANYLVYRLLEVIVILSIILPLHFSASKVSQQSSEAELPHLDSDYNSRK